MRIEGQIWTQHSHEGFMEFIYTAGVAIHRGNDNMATDKDRFYLIM